MLDAISLHKNDTVVNISKHISHDKYNTPTFCNIFISLSFVYQITKILILLWRLFFKNSKWLISTLKISNKAVGKESYCIIKIKVLYWLWLYLTKLYFIRSFILFILSLCYYSWLFIRIAFLQRDNEFLYHHAILIVLELFMFIYLFIFLYILFELE